MHQLVRVPAIESSQKNWEHLGSGDAMVQLSTTEVAKRVGVHRATIVGSQSQSAVGSQLSLGTEAIGCLHQRNQQSGADGADRRNLPQ
jgi:hypothetical protein